MSLPTLYSNNKKGSSWRRIVLVEFRPIELNGEWGNVLKHLVAKVDVVAGDVCHDPHHKLLRPLLRWRSLSFRLQDLWSSILSDTDGPRRLVVKVHNGVELVRDVVA